MGVGWRPRPRSGAPEAAIVAACFSAARDDTLHSIAEEISTAGIHALAFCAAAEDRAAGAYCVEFVRAMAAGADVVRANRVAVAAAAEEDRATALEVLFVPAVINGYRALARRIDGIGERLGALEAGQAEILQRLMALEACSRRHARGQARAVR